MVKRDIWGSRTAFVLASIGSAIGLGNLWRFPMVCFENGGGAFLIAYGVCLIVAGIPLLMLEFSIGKRMNNAAPGAFLGISPKLEWFGWFAVGVGFIITTYYSGIMSWCLNYLIFSFKNAWGANPNQFFFNDFLKITTDTARPWSWGAFRWPIFIGMIVAWVWMVASIWKGTKTVGKVVWFTVLGPWILLLVFVVRGVTLQGASEGLAFYLTPEWIKLLDPQVWLAAVSQVFFSLTVGFGVMIAYGSFIDDKTCIVKNAWIIGLADAGTAIIGGFAVFGALGHKRLLQAAAVGVSPDSIPFADVVRGGPGFTFVTYPEIINALPWPQLFGVLFFVMLSLLAVDSAFSLVEGVSAALKDKFGWSHKKSNITVAVCGFLLGLPYVFGAGIWWLDIVDRFMNQFGLTFVVLGQCLIIGWVMKAGRMRHYINSRSEGKIGIWWDIRIQLIIPAFILVMLGFEVYQRIQKPYGEFGLRSQEFVWGWLVIALLIIAGIVIAKIKGIPDYERLANTIPTDDEECGCEISHKQEKADESELFDID